MRVLVFIIEGCGPVCEALRKGMRLLLERTSSLVAVRSGMDAAASSDEQATANANTLEVEEAELSSEEEAETPYKQTAFEKGELQSDPDAADISPSPNSPEEDDFVIEEEDEDDGGSSNNEAVGSGDDSDAHSFQVDEEQSASEDEEPENDKLRQQLQAEGMDDKNEDRDYIPTAVQDEEDDHQPDEHAVNSAENSDYSPSEEPSVISPDDKSALTSKQISKAQHRHRGQKLVIPEDMLDDEQYFRRSRRARTAPTRLSLSPDGSASSDAQAESDSDFEANEGAYSYSPSLRSSRHCSLLWSLCADVQVNA